MSDLFLGFYLGVFSIILLFNLLWYLYNREKAYLYYFFLHLSIVLLALANFNIINISTILVAISSIFFTFLFTREFLNLDKYYKNIDGIFTKSALGFTALLFVLFITDNEIIIKHIPFSLMIFTLVIIAYNVYKRGFELAKYYIIAWGVTYIVVLLTDINRIFGIDILHFKYLSQVGNILEAVILSFALFAKTKMLNEEKKEKENMLIHQARLASMGEMLANISHQWRQPLNRIAAFIMNMQMHIMEKYEKEQFLLKKLDESQEQLEYMSQTIEDFTNFYKKNKQKEKFFVSKSIYSASSIISSTLESSNIELQIKVKEDFEINSYPKELAQVILNLLQNAKDAIKINKIKEPKIIVEIEKNKILIEDNAKGIDEKIIDKIFDPYFTTKEKSKGTGLGLYMSKMILERNMNAKIIVENTKSGSKFIITFI